MTEQILDLLPWLVGVPTLAAVLVLAILGLGVALACWAFVALPEAMGVL